MESHCLDRGGNTDTLFESFKKDTVKLAVCLPRFFRYIALSSSITISCRQFWLLSRNALLTGAACFSFEKMTLANPNKGGIFGQRWHISSRRTVSIYAARCRLRVRMIIKSTNKSTYNLRRIYTIYAVVVKIQNEVNATAVSLTLLERVNLFTGKD